MGDMIGPLFGVFTVRLVDVDGRPLWTKRVKNLITNVGKKDILDKYFLGSAYTGAFYIGLKGEGTPAVADTMAAHATWTEYTAYTQSARPAFSPSAATISSPNASINNLADPAMFTFNADGTVGGMFIATNSTKGGTTGILFNAANFVGGSEDVTNGQSFFVHYALTVG